MSFSIGAISPFTDGLIIENYANEKRHLDTVFLAVSFFFRKIPTALAEQASVAAFYR